MYSSSYFAPRHSPLYLPRFLNTCALLAVSTQGTVPPTAVPTQRTVLYTPGTSAPSQRTATAEQRVRADGSYSRDYVHILEATCVIIILIKRVRHSHRKRSVPCIHYTCPPIPNFRCLEGGHELSGIVGNDALEQGYGTVDLLLGHEAKDADHGETTIVDLRDEAALELRGRRQRRGT